MSKQCIDCDWSLRLPLTFKEQRHVQMQDPNSVPLYCVHVACRSRTPSGEIMSPLTEHVRSDKMRCGPRGEWWTPTKDLIPVQPLTTGTFKRVEKVLGGNINARAERPPEESNVKAFPRRYPPAVPTTAQTTIRGETPTTVLSVTPAARGRKLYEVTKQ